MIGWVKHLKACWDNWSGDRDMELAIRRHLTREGYFGGTAKGARVAAGSRPAARLVAGLSL